MAVWLPTIKSQESTLFSCVMVVCDIPLESSWQGLQLFFIPHHNRRSAQEVMRPQSCKSPNCGNFGTKSHLDVALVESCRVYYKGENGGFPQVQAVVNLVCPSCLWFVLASKVLQLCTNHFVLVVCKSMWVIEACHFFQIPSRSSNTPLYPFTMLRAEECAPTSCSFVVFSLGLAFESLKELGARQYSFSNLLLTLLRLPMLHWWFVISVTMIFKLGTLNYST